MASAQQNSLAVYFSLDLEQHQFFVMVKFLDKRADLLVAALSCFFLGNLPRFWLVGVAQKHRVALQHEELVSELRAEHTYLHSLAICRQVNRDPVYCRPCVYVVECIE